MFEQASRMKLRYSTNYGIITCEELWDIPLFDLDQIAQVLRDEVAASGKESFIDEDSGPTQELALRFKIVKHVIKVKLVERDSNNKERERAQERQKLMELIVIKDDEKLSSMSREDLMDKLKSLSA